MSDGVTITYMYKYRLIVIIYAMPMKYAGETYQAHCVDNN